MNTQHVTRTLQPRSVPAAPAASGVLQIFRLLQHFGHFTFDAQLLKHGMNAFAQSRMRRLTSDRLLTMAVSMQRQTLARGAISSGSSAAHFYSLSETQPFSDAFTTQPLS
jgi:hypothetical protein